MNDTCSPTFEPTSSNFTPPSTFHNHHLTESRQTTYNALSQHRDTRLSHQCTPHCSHKGQYLGFGFYTHLNLNLAIPHAWNAAYATNKDINLSLLAPSKLCDVDGGSLPAGYSQPYQSVSTANQSQHPGSISPPKPGFPSVPRHSVCCPNGTAPSFATPSTSSGGGVGASWVIPSSPSIAQPSPPKQTYHPPPKRSRFQKLCLVCRTILNANIDAHRQMLNRPVATLGRKTEFENRNKNAGYIRMSQDAVRTLELHTERTSSPA